MNVQTPNLTLLAPLSGELKPIECADDPVFAQRLVGDGVVIEPANETLTAPFDGVVSQLHDAHHAVAIKHASGVEVLMHIGVDTVTLKGEGFEPKVRIGDTVTPGQALIRFSKSTLTGKNVSVQTAVLLTSGHTVSGTVNAHRVTAGEDALFQLSGADEPVTEAGQGANSATADGTTVSDVVIIGNPQGLHARPAAQLVQVVKAHQSTVTLRRTDDDRLASGLSVTELLGLQTKNGTELELRVTGTDAADTLAALVQAINDGLGETVSFGSNDPADDFPEEAPLMQTSGQDTDRLRGVKASGGLATGKYRFRARALPDYPEQGVTPEEELGQLHYALLQAHKSLDSLIQRLEDRKMTKQADVFRAHAQLLEDPALIDNAKALIADRKSAMYAWHQSYLTEAGKLKQMDDPLLKARGADIDDIGLTVMQILLGIQPPSESLSEPTVLVLDDITPSEVVSLNPESIVGLATLGGGSTSHAAILAGSLGFPYLVNIDPAIRDVTEGTPLILNADQGWLQVNPGAEQIEQFFTEQQRLADQYEQAQSQAHLPATTADGVHIEVAANVADVEHAEKARAAGADGIGLVRSEFLYMDRASEPGFAEQVDVYRGLLNGIGKDRPCIIRTLDVGGDKPLAYLPMPAEDNPFLGERGLRIGLNRPHLLRKQVRAILTAADAGTPRIMFPMVAGLDEFRAARQLVQEEQERLGLKELEVGVMIEVPSAALMADVLAAEVDFFSIGTNDLTQYTLAMDRGHPKLAAQVDALHPAVLRLIHQTATASQKHGKWTGICGSIASDPDATAILIGLGVTELSTSLPNLPLVKEKVRSLNLAECRKLASDAMNKATAAEVRALLN